MLFRPLLQQISRAAAWKHNPATPLRQFCATRKLGGAPTQQPSALTPKQLADLEFEAWLASNLPAGKVVPAKPAIPQVPVIQDPSDLDKPKSRRRFSWAEAARVLHECTQKCDLAWKTDRSGFWATDKATGVISCEVVLPRILTPYKDAGGSWLAGDPASFIADLTDGEDPLTGKVRCGMQLITCLSHESAALGIWREGQLVRHKVIRGYTVRRTQGKAQLTYIQGGGGAKSKGSAIRAKEAIRLFHKIALKLREWKSEIAACNQVYASGTVRVWNAIYGTRKPPPLPRDDPRWRRLGIGVRLPRLPDLERAYNTISHGSDGNLCVLVSGLNNDTGL
ncbi:hypothetical protein WJX72_002656 [[Myrmecia] bisecta]|uniref:VLRF1 domain-containing protein n=1 Tax=[Myrmecia] bisecta TaxID=41462 RepID=A0AAW1PRF2_9CHLO